MIEVLVTTVLKNPYIWGMALTYFFIYVIRQGVTSWCSPPPAAASVQLLTGCRCSSLLTPDKEVKGETPKSTITYSTESIRGCRCMSLLLAVEEPRCYKMHRAYRRTGNHCSTLNVSNSSSLPTSITRIATIKDAFGIGVLQ